MKPSKKIQKKLESRMNGYKQMMNGNSVWAKAGGYRAPGSRKKKKG